MEHIVLHREKKMQLNTVKYENFERSVQRFGYVGKLTDSTLKEISEEIRISDMKDIHDRNEYPYFYYHSQKVFDHGNYDSRRLLMMGFVLTSHPNQEKA